jgi:hypothetical protein
MPCRPGRLLITWSDTRKPTAIVKIVFTTLLLPQSLSRFSPLMGQQDKEITLTGLSPIRHSHTAPGDNAVVQRHRPLPLQRP